MLQPSGGDTGGTLRKLSKHGALKYRVCFIHEQRGETQIKFEYELGWGIL